MKKSPRITSKLDGELFGQQLAAMRRWMGFDSQESLTDYLSEMSVVAQSIRDGETPEATPELEKKARCYLYKQTSLGVHFTRETIAPVETGKRPPTEEALWALLSVFAGERGGLLSPMEAQQWVEHVSRSLTKEELQVLFPDYVPGQEGRQRWQVPYVAGIPRSEVMDKILAKLVGDEARSAIVALVGPAGIGKTVLGKMVGWSWKVRSQFPDGIVWVEAGPKVEGRPVMEELFKVLGLAHESLEDGLRRALGQQRLLVIVDDVWEPNAVNWWQKVAGPNARLLITGLTRSIAEVDVPPSMRVEVGPMDESEGIKYCRWSLGLQESDVLPQEAVQIGRLLGWYPLLLQIFLSRGISALGEVLSLLEQEHFEPATDLESGYELFTAARLDRQWNMISPLGQVLWKGLGALPYVSSWGIEGLSFVWQQCVRGNSDVRPTLAELEKANLIQSVEEDRFAAPRYRMPWLIWRFGREACDRETVQSWQTAMDRYGPTAFGRKQWWATRQVPGAPSGWRWLFDRRWWQAEPGSYPGMFRRLTPDHVLIEQAWRQEYCFVPVEVLAAHTGLKMDYASIWVAIALLICIALAALATLQWPAFLIFLASLLVIFWRQTVLLLERLRFSAAWRYRVQGDQASQHG